ncbi:MAG: biotin/lipoyl-containing protein [Christensenella sp.]|uniref:acetyl-CoA carboxylase biotin carboxyl carrier protein n=1 Tax=Christensenella sp. TaxID=1935934 RepID=UPI002B1F4A94|nr:biotin/lipoyl-containing protein [Christensenella sp.]MEA5002920.1 biotin/lipoyl-containing protein [Christensenella sp.]
MDLKSILELLKAVDKSGFDTFELNDKDFSLILERNANVPVQQVMVSAPAQAAPMAAAPMIAAAPVAPAAVSVPEAAVAASEAPAVAEDRGKEIVSPLVGVFHKLAEGKAVKIGDKLKKGDIVCMVEAMKLMNEITMPEAGEITWAACEEGDSVEYGQLLFNYK